MIFLRLLRVFELFLKLDLFCLSSNIAIKDTLLVLLIWSSVRNSKGRSLLLL